MIRFYECGSTVKKTDFVFLEEIKNAIIILFDDGVFTAEHLRKIELETLDLDTVLGKAMTRMLEMLG